MFILPPLAVRQHDEEDGQYPKPEKEDEHFVGFVLVLQFGGGGDGFGFRVPSCG